MFVYSDSPRGLNGLIHDAWRLYTATLVQIVWLSLLVALASLSITLLQQYGMPIMMKEQHHDFLTALFIIAPIVLLLLATYVSMVILRYMHVHAAGQLPDLSNILKECVNNKRLFRLLRAMVLALIVVGIGLMLYILPGLVLIVFLSLLMPLVVVRDLPVFKSFKLSFVLVWGNWWLSLGLIAGPACAALIVAILLGRFVPSGLTRHLIDTLVATLLTPWVYSVQLVLLNELSWRYDQAYEA